MAVYFLEGEIGDDVVERRSGTPLTAVRQD
jgi:hypothetical protein